MQGTRRTHNAWTLRAGREDGVSAVIVTLSLVAILASAVLAIDSGHAWKTRRDLVTDTDAAALGAARYLAESEARCWEAVASGSSSGAGGEAALVMGRNDEASRMVAFAVRPYGGDCASGAGQVQVDGRLLMQTSFAGVFGVGEVDAFSSSTAQWGPVVAATGMRPIGICDQLPAYRDWAAGAVPEGTVHRIYVQRGDSGCGEAAGNWDWLDFNGNNPPNGTTALREWLRSGYPGVVSLSDPGTGETWDCNPEDPTPGGCPPKTGAGGSSHIDSLDYLRENGVVFPIIVYDRVVDRRDPLGCETPRPWSGDGDNAVFCHVAFLMVRIHAWDRITGRLSDASYVDLEFVDALWVGSIGGPRPGPHPPVTAIGLCGGNYATTLDELCDV